MLLIFDKFLIFNSQLRIKYLSNSRIEYTEKNSSKNFTQLLAKMGHMDKLEIIWYYCNNLWHTKC